MACCAAIALVIGLARGLWFRLVPGARPAQTTFAPPVRRPLGAAGLRSTVATPPRASRRLAPAVLTGVAVGTLGYAALIAMLLLSGVATRQASAWWIPRDVALVLVAGIAAALGRGRGKEIAPVLLGAGISWSELGLVDMHLLGLFAFSHLGVIADLLFHGTGLLLVVLTLPRVLSPNPKAVTA